MEFSDRLRFLGILKESIKLLPKNGKLMALITLLSMVLSTLLYLIFTFILQSLIVDLFVTFKYNFMPDHRSYYQDPSSSAHLVGDLVHLRKGYALLLAVIVAFCLSFTVVSLLSTIATTLLAAMSYKDKTLSLKDLCLGIARKWKKTIITDFYVSLLSTGYMFFVLSLLLPLLMYSTTLSIVVAVLIAFAGLIFFYHLVVIWVLAILVPVIEENTYGMKALGKAAELAKGNILCGVKLNLFFNVLVGIVLQVYRMVLSKKGQLNPLVYGVLVVSFSVLVNIFRVVAYTVFYFECKKSHGEEVELHGSIEYMKLPTTNPVGQ